MSKLSPRRQLEAICNNARVALFIMDEHQHCTYVNPAAVELTGFSFEELRGRPLHDVIHHTRPDGSHYPIEECPIDRAFPEKHQEQGEDIFVHKDGHFYDVGFTASPIIEGDRTVGTVIEVQDITARKRRERNQAFLTAVADDLSRLSTEDEIVDSIGAALGKFLTVASCFYAEMVSSCETAAPTILWQSGDQAKLAGGQLWSTLVSEGMCRVAQAGETQIVGDTSSDPGTQTQGFASCGIRAYVAVPVFRSNQCRYLLAVTDSQPRRWREDEVELLEELARRFFPRLERARAEATRRESEERYHLIARATNDVIWDWNLATNRVEWNEAVTDHFGCSPEQLGHSIDSWYERIHPDDVDRVVARFKKAMGRGENSWRDEYRFRKNDGSYAHFLDRGYIARDREGEVCRIIGSMFDLSERRQAELERARLHALVENSTDFIGIADAEGNPVFLNPAGREMVGLDPDAPLSKLTVEDFYAPDQRKLVRNTILPAMKKGERWSGDTFFQHFKTKARIPVSDTHFAFVHPENGQLIGHATITRDISDRKQAEAALRENDRRKDEFLAMLAHELRNPLAAISNTVELLRRSVHEAHLADWVEILKRQSIKLGGMVDDLLDVSRVTRGIVSLKRERVDLLRVVASSMQSLQTLMDEKAHEIKLDLPADPIKVSGDLMRLEQILVNLLTNAAKYTDPGGRIEISLKAEEGWAELRVRDNGIGLGADTLAHVFDLFGQAERGLARSEGGLGIGLTIVKTLVQLHGGEIVADSAGLGKGAEFVVTLPLMGAAMAEVEATVAPVSEQSSTYPPGDSKRVLIVEDNAEVADTLALLLEAGGHRVFVARDGPDAIARAEELAPELVLLDIGLPEMDGYEVARRLRELPATRDSVLAALTGYGQAGDRERVEAAGFDAHFVKPVDVSELEAFICVSNPRLVADLT